MGFGNRASRRRINSTALSIASRNAFSLAATTVFPVTQCFHPGEVSSASSRSAQRAGVSSAIRSALQNFQARCVKFIMIEDECLILI